MQKPLHHAGAGVSGFDLVHDLGCLNSSHHRCVRSFEFRFVFDIKSLCQLPHRIIPVAFFAHVTLRGIEPRHTD